MAAVALAIAIALPLGAASALGDEGGDNQLYEFHVALTGDAERPNPVDTDAHGMAHVGLKLKAGAVEWLMVSVVVCDIENAMAAHIHAPAGPEATAGVRVPLYGPGPAFSTEACAPLMKFKVSGDELAGMLQGIDMDGFIDAMTSGNAYINVHTQVNPPGAIRGQLV